MAKNKTTGRRVVAPAPEFKTQTFYFDGLPSVALVLPDPLNPIAAINTAAEVARQMSVRMLNFVAEQALASAQRQDAAPSQRIMGPDDAAPAVDEAALIAREE